MKYIGFLITLLITLGLAAALSFSFGQIPPLAGLLDPYHGFWQNSYSEDEKTRGLQNLHGLQSDVEVMYDENLIPHVFAQNEEDLYRAQGYITATLRLWQMEFQTMAAAGRISEIVGEQALEFDRLQRRKGLGFGAESGLKFIEENDPENFLLMQAYADGVNQYIDQLKAADLPVEYKLLNYRPEKWSVYKTVLLLKYMADMLVSDNDLEYTNLRFLLGEPLMEKLYPDFPGENDPVIEAEKVWDFTPLEADKPENIPYPDSLLLLDPLPKTPPGIGSNNWAVSGKKTRNGNPILANDPHLKLNLPSLWFAMQLTTPKHSVKGVTLPGALGIISGFNENIAWGVTNATRDVRDWYAITFKDETRLEYLYNDQWIQSTLRLENIKVKGGLDYVDTVIYTHYGPVVYDDSFRSSLQNKNFALKWDAHQGSNEQSTFLLLNKGKNHGDYLAALNHFNSPAQNFVFASRSGDIAMKVQGKFPLKWKGQGKYLMDGNNPDFEWKGYVPFDQNPSTLNPERGFVSSANQHSVDSSYPYYVFDHSFEHYRNRRLNTRLSEMEQITIEDMKALQFDNFHLHASEILPTMLEYLLEDSTYIKEERFKPLVDDLAKWDFHTYPNQTAPTIFDIWWRHLQNLSWGKWREEGAPVVYPNKYQSSQLLKEGPENIVYDLKDTEKRETGKDLVRISFQNMTRELEEWIKVQEDGTWANYKNTSILHLVPDFEAFSHTNVYTGGGQGMINATGPRDGASWRYVVELGEEITAFGIYPGGQSGNPGSKFYANFIKLWANGGYLDFNLRNAAQRQDLLFRTILEPEK